MPRLGRVAGAETSAAEVSDILNRDGTVVVEGALGSDMLKALNADLHRFVDDIGVGMLDLEYR